jgi:hypothetical protein
MVLLKGEQLRDIDTPLAMLELMIDRLPYRIALGSDAAREWEHTILELIKEATSAKIDPHLQVVLLDGLNRLLFAIRQSTPVGIEAIYEPVGKVLATAARIQALGDDAGSSD